MDQFPESEHSVSSPGPSVIPTSSLEHAISVHHASNIAPSQVGISRDHSTEHIPTSPTSVPVLTAPIPIASFRGTYPSVPFVSDQGPSSSPAFGLDGNSPRSTQRNPVPQTSLVFENEDPRQRPLPLQPLPTEVLVRTGRIGLEGPPASRPRSGIDYIVPVNGKTSREKTVGERLEPILLTAIAERDKYTLKAKMTGYALNIAIGLQVILGALTTGLASVAATSHQTALATAILGGFSTITASYLARARGSNEPELSITRVKDLEQFIRQCEAFQMDHGQTLGNKYDKEVQDLRGRFEELLGNLDGNSCERTFLLYFKARIKKIMQKDEEVGKVAQATPIVISKALELFLGLIMEQASKVTTERGSKKVEAYHLKHAVETTEMLDFLKEIVEGVPDPSAGGTIDLESENAEAAAKKKRGKGKKAAGNGEGEPSKKRRKKKGGDEEGEGMDWSSEPKQEQKDGKRSRQVVSNYRPRSPSSDDGYDENS
ncbi:hypothetical protein C0993_005870 [Termitomyces sp. T159_Od127]|nr:hypothetical protein C0993_005870 [Termitomyces sp. T159_Od127]